MHVDIIGQEKSTEIEFYFICGWLSLLINAFVSIAWIATATGLLIGIVANCGCHD